MELINFWSDSISFKIQFYGYKQNIIFFYFINFNIRKHLMKSNSLSKNHGYFIFTNI